MLVLLSLLLGLAALALLLMVPVDVRFEASGDRTWKVRVRVDWMYGRVGRDFEPRASARPEKKRSWPSRDQLDLLRQEPFWQRAKLALRRCRRYVDVEEIRGHLRLGLGDPADTGIAYGMIQPILRLLGALPGVSLQVVPDFAAAGIGGVLRGGVRLVPIGLLAHGVAFILSPEAIGSYRRFRSLRK